MSTFTIYVPSYVDLKTIQTCPLDSRATFVTVDPETFSIEAKRQEHSKFIVFEKDHFLVYEKESPEPFKCSYYSRNYIMSLVGYLGLTRFVSYGLIKFEYNEGLVVNGEGGVLSFIYRPDAECLDKKHRDCGGGIAEFYDTVEEEDFERFAEIARTKENCNKEFFLVNRGQTYHIVDTNDPSIRYTFSPALKNDVILQVSHKRTTIQGLLEDEKDYLKRREKAKCVAGFELRDNQGVPLPEGTKFELEIYNEEYHGRKDTEDGSEDDAYDEDGITVEYLSIFGMRDSPLRVVCNIDCGPRFGFKVVDGITYLTIDNLYIGIGEGDYANEMVATAEIPPKDRRIQIRYAEDGNIFLSGWDGSSHISC
ncbi:hypothetical protein LPJ56_001982, partial [Coemansia sp. RSA 2599]